MSVSRQGILFVISAPSGGGKTTLVRRLTASDPSLRVSVSHTTRQRRAGEEDGIAYHFVTRARFEELVAASAFFEHARVFDHFYGTSREWVGNQLQAGIDVILEIDWQGARQVRELAPDAVGIFILPPGLDVLAARLRGRGDTEDVVARRMRDARAEISHYGEYDYVVVNDDLEQAYADLAAIIRAARCRYRLHRPAIDGRVQAMLR